jgi:hypothetical protein
VTVAIFELRGRVACMRILNPMFMLNLTAGCLVASFEMLFLENMELNSASWGENSDDLKEW